MYYHNNIKYLRSLGQDQLWTRISRIGLFQLFCWQCCKRPTHGGHSDSLIRHLYALLWWDLQVQSTLAVGSEWIRNALLEVQSSEFGQTILRCEHWKSWNCIFPVLIWEHVHRTNALRTAIIITRLWQEIKIKAWVIGVYYMHNLFA